MIVYLPKKVTWHKGRLKKSRRIKLLLIGSKKKHKLIKLAKVYIYIYIYIYIYKLKIKSVTYSSQGSYTGQLEFRN